MVGSGTRPGVDGECKGPRKVLNRHCKLMGLECWHASEVEHDFAWSEIA